MEIEIRDLEEKDIRYIADYWLLSDPDYLVGMGVDLDKLPSRDQLQTMLKSQLETPDDKKYSLALILTVDKKPIGHCNVNEIRFGDDAKMHLHIWFPEYRKRGLGLQMVEMSLPHFFNRLNLQTLWCEPYAKNPAPNRTLEKLGFEFVKTHINTPGSLNFEQETNLYKMTEDQFRNR